MKNKSPLEEKKSREWEITKAVRGVGI